jgi:hypothetical protein
MRRQALSVPAKSGWECARKLEARIMRIGCGAAHGFWKGSAVFLALLSGRGGFGCGGVVEGFVAEI